MIDLVKSDVDVEDGPELYTVGGADYGVKTRNTSLGSGDTMVPNGTNLVMMGTKSFILAKHIDSVNDSYLAGPTNVNEYDTLAFSGPAAWTFTSEKLIFSPGTTGWARATSVNRKEVNLTKTYTETCTVQRIGGTGGRARTRIQWYDATGTYIGASDGTFTEVPESPITLSLTATPMAGAVTYAPVVDVEGATTDGQVEFTNVAVEEFPGLDVRLSPISVTVGVETLDFNINTPNVWSVYEFSFYPPGSLQGGTFGAIGFRLDGSEEELKILTTQTMTENNTTASVVFGSGNNVSGGYITRSILIFDLNKDEEIFQAIREELNIRRKEIADAEDLEENPPVSFADEAGVYLNNEIAPLGPITSVQPPGLLGITMNERVLNGDTPLMVEDGIKFFDNSLINTQVGGGPYDKIIMLFDVTIHGPPSLGAFRGYLGRVNGQLLDSDVLFEMRYYIFNDGLPQFLLIGPGGTAMNLTRIKGIGERQTIGAEIDMTAGTLKCIESDGEIRTGPSIPTANISIADIEFGIQCDATIHGAVIYHEPNIPATITQTGGVVTNFDRNGVEYTQILWDTAGSFSFSADKPFPAKYALGAAGGSAATGWHRGGGAGGQVIPYTDPAFLDAGAYALNIGAGQVSLKGQDSILTLPSGSVTALGGGRGIGGNSLSNNNPGYNGGGGSGAISETEAIGYPGQGGFGGGTGYRTTVYTAGGGAGAGGPGGDYIEGVSSGAGGAGINLPWTDGELQVGGGGSGAAFSGAGFPEVESGSVSHNGGKGAYWRGGEGIMHPSQPGYLSGGAGGYSTTAGDNPPQAPGGNGFFVMVVRSDRVNVV